MVEVVYRKLLRHKAIGLAWTESDKIEIDSRLKGKELLYILIHELCHLHFPSMTEEEVIKLSEFLSENIWEQNFRKVDQ